MVLWVCLSAGGEQRAWPRKWQRISSPPRAGRDESPVPSIAFDDSECSSVLRLTQNSRRTARQRAANNSVAKYRSEGQTYRTCARMWGGTGIHGATSAGVCMIRMRTDETSINSIRQVSRWRSYFHSARARSTKLEARLRRAVALIARTDEHVVAGPPVTVFR
jgi:hypothetical protein